MLSDADLQKALGSYEKVIEAQAVSRKTYLDAHFLEDWRERVCDKADTQFLSELMKWKLGVRLSGLPVQAPALRAKQRGKMRPRLQQLVAENADAEVQEAVTEAQRSIRDNDGLKALRALTVLRGIGPATASAILCLLNRDYAFMSDECMEALGAKREYTEKAWLAFQKLVDERKSAWTGGAEELERACYAAVAGRRLGVIDGETEEPVKKRRKKG